jgi:hypothetical protein
LPLALTAACDPLPPLVAVPGQDLRGPLLQNRAEAERVHAECTARHRAVVQAVNPASRPARADRSTRPAPADSPTATTRTTP